VSAAVVRVPAVWTSSFGYAASESICVEALANMLGRHLAQKPPSHQGEGASSQPGLGVAGGQEGTGATKEGAVEGRFEAAIVGCVAELAELIGVPEEYLNALATTLGGYPCFGRRGDEGRSAGGWDAGACRAGATEPWVQPRRRGRCCQGQ